MYFLCISYVLYEYVPDLGFVFFSAPHMDISNPIFLIYSTTVLYRSVDGCFPVLKCSLKEWCISGLCSLVFLCVERIISAWFGFACIFTRLRISGHKLCVGERALQYGCNQLCGNYVRGRRGGGQSKVANGGGKTEQSCTYGEILGGKRRSKEIFHFISFRLHCNHKACPLLIA